MQVGGSCFSFSPKNIIVENIDEPKFYIIVSVVHVLLYNSILSIYLHGFITIIKYMPFYILVFPLTLHYSISLIIVTFNEYVPFLLTYDENLLASSEHYPW